MILKDGKKLRVGFTCSAFDLLHAGHISMLEEARMQCDYLIVGLHGDPSIDRPEKNKPVQSILERSLQLRAVKHVDEIIVYETENDLECMLKMLPIDVRIIGEEYRNVWYTGKNIPGIETHYNKRRHTYSTSDLRKRIENGQESTRNDGSVSTTAGTPGSSSGKPNGSSRNRRRSSNGEG